MVIKKIDAHLYYEYNIDGDGCKMCDTNKTDVPTRITHTFT